MSYIKEEGGYLKIGGLTREAELENSPLIRSKYPIIFDTARVIADPQVRNMATWRATWRMVIRRTIIRLRCWRLGAQVVAVGPQGERVLPIESFFVTLFTTELQHDEIVSEIRIPVPPPRSGGAYLKLERKVGDFATAGVAAQVTVDGGGICQKCRHRPDQRGCDTREGQSRRRNSCAERSWMRPPSRRRHNWPPTKHSQARICAALRNTRGAWSRN